MWFVVGIDDDGTLYGHDESWAKATEEAVSQNINNKLDPNLACESITCEVFDSQWVVILELRNPGAVVKWDKNAYKASGTTTETEEGSATTNTANRDVTVTTDHGNNTSTTVVTRYVDTTVTTPITTKVYRTRNYIDAVKKNTRTIKLAI